MNAIVPDLVIIVGSIFLAGAYAGFETGNYLLNRVRLHFRVDQEDRRARILDRTLRDGQLFICTVLVGHNLAVYMASVTTTALYAGTDLFTGTRLVWGFLPWSPEIAATLTLTLPFFLLAEVGPKNLFRTRANTLMYDTAQVLRYSLLLLQPVTLPLRALSRLVSGRDREGAANPLVGMSRQRLRVFFAEGTSEGVLSDHQGDMVASVMSMRSTPVTAAMIPIARAVCAPVTGKVADFIRLTRGRNISRVAVYRGDRSRVAGLVHIFDIMDPAVRPDDPLDSHIRQAVRLQASTSIQAALYELQRKHQPMAVVEDRRGRSVGLVSLEDLAGYIVGRTKRTR